MSVMTRSEIRCGSFFYILGTLLYFYKTKHIQQGGNKNDRNIKAKQ